MIDALALCRDLPLLSVPAGETLMQENVRSERLYVLVDGAFDVVRNGVRVVQIAEPGAFIGEISAVLGSAPSASVVALRDSRVHIVDQASQAVERNPALTLAIAQLLARRLQALTAYLVDIKRQYDGSDSHLALMDQVLANLIALQPGMGVATGDAAKGGSERGDMPGY